MGLVFFVLFFYLIFLNQFLIVISKQYSPLQKRALEFKWICMRFPTYVQTVL